VPVQVSQTKFPEMTMNRLRVPRLMSAAAGLVVMTVACDSSSANGRQITHDARWHEVRDSTSTTEISLGSPCTDCLEINRVATLGDTTIAGSLTYVSSATLDSAGRYWLGQKGHMKVFASSGEHVRSVGHAGAGPMEFQDPMPVHTDVAGRVHVIDRTNARESIIAPDYSLVADGPSRLQGAFSLAPLEDGSAYLANMWAPNERSLGFPLHVVRGERISRSFGSLPKDEVVDVLSSQRIVAVDSDGRAFSAPRFTYLIEVHAQDGMRIMGLRGPQLNSQVPTRAAVNLRDNPLPSEIIGMRVDSQSRLWVLIRRPRENWRSFVVERLHPDGTVGIQMRPGTTATVDSLFRTHIDVIDLTERAIIARDERRELLNGFVGDGLLYQNFEDGDGIPKVAIWRAALPNP
jgi:hypothetical protein